MQEKSPGVEQAPVCAPVVVPDPTVVEADVLAAGAEVATTVVAASAVVVGTTTGTNVELLATEAVMKTPPGIVAWVVAVAMAVVAE
jgi:hypothetical protein